MGRGPSTLTNRTNTESAILNTSNTSPQPEQSLPSDPTPNSISGPDAGESPLAVSETVAGAESLQPALAITVQAPTRPLAVLLDEIEKYAAWDPPESGKPQLDLVLAECRAGYPDQETAIRERLRRGQQARELLKPFYDLGRIHGKDSREAKAALAKLQRRRPDLVRKANNQMERGVRARHRHDETQNRRQNGKPISAVKLPSGPIQPSQAPVTAPGQHPLPPVSSSALHPKDIRGMQPSPAWTLLIDETGTTFDGSAEGLKPADRALGRLVGLLLPQSHGLASLPSGWHAVNQGIAEIDRVVQAILNTPAGVLGVTVQQLPLAPMERWTFGVLRLIDLVLRLLPLAGPTTLTVQVEQRAEFSGGMEWPAIAYDAILRLSQAYPDRAARIECRVQVIAKDGSPLNGYVDALAFIWGSPAPHSRECLKKTGLAGACFLPGDAAAISRAWEWLDRGITLEGGDWATLLAQPEAGQPGSLAGTILERLGQASRNDAALWRRYLDHTLGHLESKAIDLRVLGRQVEWLERWSPEGQALPPPARLLWLTAKLARANHLGEHEQPWMREMHDLGNELLEENAHLVCRSELNLAVNATNCFEFDSASRVLDRWRDWPKAVPGLRYWAQVQSSLGQHAAFRGDHAAAVPLFDQALAAFARLSNPEEGQREARQTQTYRAIALMDDPAGADAEVRAAVEAVVGPLPETVARLAGSDADADKYPHHLLLRWLVQRPDPSLRATYLQQRTHWQVGEGHPWPLIQLYRGFLLYPADPAAARKLALEGYALATAENQGPLVRLIGAGCRAIAAAWGEPWPDPDTLLAPIENKLPRAGARVAAVRQFLDQPGDPLELLRTVLPFNFH